MLLFHFCMTNTEENFCHLNRKVTVQLYIINIEYRVVSYAT
jgi:hypothetical protein